MAEISQQEFFWEERRFDGNDRRKRPTRTLHHYGLTGRRSLQRRRNDFSLSGTDHFDKPVWFAALSIIIFSVLDFVLTMIILESGGTELNILMDYLINEGSVTFFVVKYCLTALAVLILLSHHQHNFMRTIKVKSILYLFAFGYFSLFLYEINIVASI